MQAGMFQRHRAVTGNSSTRHPRVLARSRAALPQLPRAKGLRMASLAPVKNRAVRDAVHRHDHLSRQGLLERAFTFAFRGLVYAQIWEDPAIDMEALAIRPDSHVVTIASG